MYDGLTIRQEIATKEEFYRVMPQQFGVYDNVTGEVKATTTAANEVVYTCQRHIDGLTFRGHRRVTPITNAERFSCTVVGSIHRYANAGGSNLTGFHLNSLQAAIRKLHLTEGLQPEIAKITSLEIGLAVKIDFPFSLLKESIVAIAGSISTPKHEEKKLGDMVCFHLSERRIKIYEAGKMRGGDPRIIRIEEKLMNTRQVIKAIGLSGQKELYLSDLLNPEIIENTQKRILALINNLAILNPNLTPSAYPNLSRRRYLRLQELARRETWAAMDKRGREKALRFVDRWADTTLKDELTRIILLAILDFKHNRLQEIFGHDQSSLLAQATIALPHEFQSLEVDKNAAISITSESRLNPVPKIAAKSSTTKIAAKSSSKIFMHNDAKTNQVMAQMVELIRTASVKNACAQMGISQWQHYRWFNTNDVYKAAINRARWGDNPPTYFREERSPEYEYNF